MSNTEENKTLVQEEILNDSCNKPEDEISNEYYMRTQKKKGSVIYTVIIICIISAIIFYGGYRYNLANNSHNSAMQSLNEEKWEEAKVKFRKSAEQGVVIYRDWEKVYYDKLNKFSEQKLFDAKSALKSAKFEQMVKDINDIPKDSTFKNDAEALLKRDPRNIVYARYITDNVKILNVENIMLSQDIPAVIIQATSTPYYPNNINALYIIFFDPKIDTFKLGYSEMKGVDTIYSSTKNASFLNDERKQVVISSEYRGGNIGKILNISVVGYDLETNSIIKYLEIPSLIRGSFEIIDNSIVTHEPNVNLDNKYIWDNNKFTEERIFINPKTGENSIVVKYTMNESNKITLDKNNVKLKMNQKLYLIRGDANIIPKRILINGSNVIDYVDGNEDCFIGKNVGSSEITIIPESYDWDNSIKISVSVIP